MSDGPRIAPCVIVLMGVSGSGKSTIGTLLSQRLGWPFRDADSFHPAANIAKMSAGVPLTDEDRWPWLKAIARWIDERRAKGEGGIVSCSALRRAYRDIIAGGRPDVRVIHLAGGFDLIDARMKARRDHFMPPALLRSQFDALEPPDAGESVTTIAIDGAPDAIVADILNAMRKTKAPA